MFLDSEGALIVNSNRPSRKRKTGENIGYPLAPEEIDWFMIMIKKAAPALTEPDAAVIEAWLRKVMQAVQRSGWVLLLSPQFSPGIGWAARSALGTNC